ncbi:MAG: 4-hydroxy-tetrahydrodipicolinate synthase [Spirochaetales bacterium]|nr:4-hydroxy-tetrahydrodipicolinate synthase [Spirochaetales bacterium]
MSYQGVYTALVTPFTTAGKVDEPALQALVEEQIRLGISGLVPMGTTGESPTLSPEEHSRVIERVVAWTKGRVPVIAGTGSNSTEEAIELTKRAQDVGANASLQVVPYYNKPNQEGLFRHFETIADKTQLPILIYNIAGRTSRNLETDTLIKLAQHPRIVGVKEASGDVGQMMEVLARRPAGFSVLSGDDNLAYPLMALGGNGVISVASHVVGRELLAMINACVQGQWDTARQLHFRLLPVFKAMFIDTNPIPVKTALALQGKVQEVFRLPMTPLDDSKKEVVRQALKLISSVG